MFPIFWRNWLSLFLLGVINNLAYVVINSSSDDLVKFFNEDNLIGLVLWANIFFGFFARLINTFLLLSWSYTSRIIITFAMFTVGIVGVALSVYIGFWFSIISIVFVGSASSFGESVLLGYLKGYESELVGGWSSGTGMAGVAGSGLYIAFKALHLSLRNSFLLLLPTTFLYLLAFFVCLTPPTKSSDHDTVAAKLAKETSEERRLISGDEPLLAESSTQQYLRCFKICWWRALNLVLVYFLEYVINPGCASKVNPDATSNSSFELANAFVILSFCYQFGVLISRSSLRFVKIRRVEILTLLQAANLVLWMLDASLHFLNPWVQFPLMVFVGLLGGASYVNVFYLLLNDSDIEEKDREICVNITAIGVIIGISSAAGFTLLMDNTWLSAVGTVATTIPPFTSLPPSTNLTLDW